MIYRQSRDPSLTLPEDVGSRSQKPISLAGSNFR
jgi:hypothetical protein